MKYSEVQQLRKHASDDFSGFKDENERLLAAKRLLLNAAIDIQNREKDSFVNLFQRSPKIYYEMAIDSKNQPYGRYYQMLNGKPETIKLKNDISRLAQLCQEIRQRNAVFFGVRGELRPDMFNKTYTMFKQNPNARVSIFSDNPTNTVTTK